jgi:stearoyl-CoA desaturase (Delta-9 desaturase)
MGELFQNNHHHAGDSPNFAQKWYELDPTYQVMKFFNLIGIIKLKRSAIIKTSFAPAEDEEASKRVSAA